LPSKNVLASSNFYGNAKSWEQPNCKLSVFLQKFLTCW